MLPTQHDKAVTLADVLPSCLASMGLSGVVDVLGLPASDSIIVVLADGLGEDNLSAASGHARFLSSPVHRHDIISTVFPSTTASALASLMTGAVPGQHGLTGYRIRDPETGELVNQLTELDLVGSHWMRRSTLAQSVDSKVEFFVVGRQKFSDSALTRVVYAGATYRSAETITERMTVAAEVARTPGRVVLVYVSELDAAAHKFGVASARWTAALEEVDGALRHLTELASPSITIVLTADHGVIDVPASGHRLVTSGSLTQGIELIGGEPRCLQLYLREGDDVESIIERWRTWVDSEARVLSRDDMLNSGLLGTPEVVDPHVLGRLGDVFVLATEQVAYYDDRLPDKAAQRMVGQHGAVSMAEMRIPLITVG